MSSGRLREDLFHRLNVVPIRVPGLTERREDIPELVRYFVQAISVASGLAPRRIGEDAMAVLQSHDWPGNVRELAMLVKRLVALHGPGPLERSMLPAEMCGTVSLTEPAPLSSSPLAPPVRKPAADQAELFALLEAMRVHGGNLAAAARALGVSRSRRAWGSRQIPRS